MEDSGIFHLTGTITDFSKWDDTINLYAQMHPDRLIDPDGIETIETSDVPYQGISYFTAEDYNLECCLDYDLPEGSFTLMFDEAPDFDGEPVEEPEEADNVFYFRKSA